MYITYYRVSTQRQGQSGLGLEAQRSAVQGFLAGKEIIAEFTEVESGRKNDRPQLTKALALAKSRKAILVIAKLDRLARNVHFISGLLESGVQFVAVDMPEADRTFLQMAAVFAEWEARKISERTKAALAAAKVRGTVLGNPNIAEANKASLARFNRAFDVWRQDSNAVRLASQHGTLRQVASDLMDAGIKTPNGGAVWNPQQVKNIRNRLASTQRLST